jgi:signal transduction histidine kinase
MKTIFTKIISIIKEELFINDPELHTTFVSRQDLVVRITFWLGFSLNLLFLILTWDSEFNPFVIPLTAINILISSVPAYYFLKTNRLEYAKFFVYFPAIILQTVTAYYSLLVNFPYENGELALIGYVGYSIIVFKKPLRIIGVLLNISLFTFIKITKYQLLPISLYELFLELSMSLTVYLILIFLADFYKFDFEKLKDINDKVNDQKLIIESQSEELKALNATKDRLFSIIAHDLRSPLSSLKGVMQLLDNEFISKEEFKQLSKRLQENVDNVHGMLENLLLWSLSQMEGIKPNVKAFDLNFIIDETVILFREVSVQKQIEINVNSKLFLQAMGDEYQVRTVLRNLLNNALKFTPSYGQITIDSIVKGQFVNLKISDSGVGIERNDLALIFSNPKLKTGTAGEKGTGFGLFLCKELIEKNGGSIGVKSEFGKGTTIDILLPVRVN